MPGRRKTSPVSAAACVALAVLAAACNSDSATTGPSGLQGKDFAANLRLVSGDQQLGPIGSALALPITVRVVDAGGQPVAGATVSFSVRSGGGSINPAANISDVNGIVSSVWTMGTALGANKAVAILTNSFVLDSAVFTATATTGPISVFTIVSGNNQTTNASRTLPVPLVVKAQDAFGNNLSGVKVVWTPAAASGSVSFTTDTTAADGTATASWTLGIVASAQSLTASLPVGGTPLTFSATATADTGRIVTVTASPAATGTASTSVGTMTLRVTDQYSNVAPGVSITWTDSIAGGGSVSTLVGTTSAAGTASSTWTLGRRLGTQLVRAKLTGRTETAVFTSTATIGFSDVIAGNAMACAVAASTSAVYCWGAGNDGQLGKGGVANSNVPSVAVSQSGDTVTGVLLQARQVSGGRNGFCTLSIARTLYCWGRQLGGTTNLSPTATTLSAGGAGIIPNGIAIGEDFGCLLTLAGDGFCSGNNFNGQLGNGAAPTGAAVGTWVSTTAPPSYFSAIATGRAHACGIPRYDPTSLPLSQRVYCWGLNNSGQVGDGTLTNKLVPTLTTSLLRFDSTMVVAGAAHSCAVEATGSTAPGQAWCWGSNGSGQLGAGAGISQSNAPVAVSAPAGGAVTYVRLYAGEFNTCGLTAAGAAYCWGRNDVGQVGTGTATPGTPIYIPTLVSGGLTFRSLSVGESFICGVSGTPGLAPTLAGIVYCWGSNQFGQLGNGTTTSILNPAAGRISFQP